MYGAGLFFPGALSQFFSVALFWGVIAVIGSGLAYIYFQEHRIDRLQSSLSDCKAVAESIEDQHKFLKKNLEIIKRNCGRKPKPVIVNGDIKLENLFNEPR